MSSLVQWFVDNSKIFSEHPSQVVCLVIVAGGSSAAFAWWFSCEIHKSQINGQKETIDTLRTQNAYLDSKNRTLAEQVRQGDISDTESTALRIIHSRSLTQSSLAKDIWTGPKQLSEFLHIDIYEANDIIMELESRNLVAEAIRNGFTRSMSPPVIITNKGIKWIDSHPK